MTFVMVILVIIVDANLLLWRINIIKVLMLI